MKAIEVKEFGGPEVLEVIEKPTPMPGKGQLLIDVKAAGVNYADIGARMGNYPPGPKLPFIPGMEVAGLISALDEGVTEFTLGQPVMGIVPSGGYAEYALLDAKSAFHVPKGLDFAPATALLVQGLTAYFLLETGNLKPGDNVLIPAAAGGVGSLAVQIAKLKGAGVVVGLASPSKHARVMALGGHPVDYNQVGWGAKVRELTGGKGIDVYLDSTGQLDGEGFSTLAQGARWLVYGALSGTMSDLPAAILGGFLFQNITLRGYTLYSSMDDPARIAAAMTELIGWVLAGKLQIDTTNHFPLTEARAAHEAISARKTTGKVTLEP